MTETELMNAGELHENCITSMTRKSTLCLIVRRNYSNNIIILPQTMKAQEQKS